MLKGAAGLPKKREATPPSVQSNHESIEPRSRLIEPAKRGAAANQATLYVVSVERRAASRPDFSRYVRPPAENYPVYHFFKRLLDIVGAIAITVALSPLVVLIVAAMLASRQNPFFRHRRVGKNGVFFDCWKFRTMVPNANAVLQRLLASDRHAREEWRRCHKLRCDPRITRLGRILRRTSFDELPQLWNVLKGDMSLVGPRPVVHDELELLYRTKVSVYLSAVPGLTGLWQISGRNDLAYRRRVALDVCYVRSRNIGLDLYILLKTLPAVISSSGAY
jgi:lipopolysaccharide/colanic/teichoic acid biosynthesis glycosyltransferase